MGVNIGSKYTLRVEREGNYMYNNKGLNPKTTIVSNTWDEVTQKNGSSRVPLVGLVTTRGPAGEINVQAFVLPSVWFSMLLYLGVFRLRLEINKKGEAPGRSCIFRSSTHLHEEVGLSRA